MGGRARSHGDRVAEDWALRKTTNRPLWLQYPRRCAATAERFHGANTGWMLVPQSIEPGDRASYQSEIEYLLLYLFALPLHGAKSDITEKKEGHTPPARRVEK